MKIKPIVLCDVDGVITNFTQFYIDCAEHVGVIPKGHVKPGWKPDQWNIGKALRLTRDGRAAVWGRMRERNVASLIELYPGAKEGVSDLMQSADVYFPTQPIYESPTWEYDRYHWFKQHFSEAVAERLIFTKDKSILFGHVMIDDKPEHLVNWKRRWGSGTAVLWPQPYNENVRIRAFRPNDHDWRWIHLRVAEAAQRGESPSWMH